MKRLVPFIGNASMKADTESATGVKIHDGRRQRQNQKLRNDS